MKVSVEKLPTSEAVLDIEISWDEMEKASEKAYRKLVQKVDVQGFRRGKAPRSLLERKIGKESIYQEGLDDLISDTYRNAVKEHDLTPLAPPKLDAPIFEMGQPYHFNLTVAIAMPPELGDYKSLHFEREEADVTSEEVEKELDNLRNPKAEWHVVERTAQYGDRVIADLKLDADERTISDLKDNPFELTNEQRHGLFDGMDEQVVGMALEETKSFTTTLPADYNNEKLAGKTAAYVVTLHKVEEKILPELDDAFAEKASNSQYSTMEEMRKAISDNILENKKRHIRDELREKVIDAVVDQTQVTVHPLLVDEEVHQLEHQFAHILEQQHMSLDQYLKMLRQTHEQYHDSLKPEAEKRAKRQLVLDEIAEKEQITVQPEELETIFRAYEQMGQPLPRTESDIRTLALSYRREKTVIRLLELTTDPDPDTVMETEAELTEDAVIANAEAAALAADTEVAAAENAVTPLEGEPTIEAQM